MHCIITSSSSSRAAVMFMTILALFTSVCIRVTAAGSIAILPSPTCFLPRNYTVAAGETCQTIAQNLSVSTNDIIALNCLNPQCTNLRANSTISLPGCCTTYTVQQNDTCTSIASPARNLSLTNFYTFNPALNSNCSNLLFGSNVCLSQPNGTPLSLPSCSAQNNASSTSAGTSAPSVASGTNTTCLPLYTAETGDTCDSIARVYHFTPQYFQQINPSINGACTNIIAGLEYCVSQP